MAIFAVFAHGHLHRQRRGPNPNHYQFAVQLMTWIFFPIQGDKFYIELYGGSVVVTKKLDYESINNYTLKILAKVSRVSLIYKRKRCKLNSIILGHLNNNNNNNKKAQIPLQNVCHSFLNWIL